MGHKIITSICVVVALPFLLCWVVLQALLPSQRINDE